jgi:xanthine dehydrogenase accessory factor
MGRFGKPDKSGNCANYMNLMRRLSGHLDAGTAVALVTVVSTDGSVPREVGAKMLVFEDGSIEGTVGGGALEAEAIRAAVDALKAGASRKAAFTLEPKKLGMYCAGQVEVFIDVFQRSLRLVILGGGHVAERLGKVAAGAGIPYVVADDRPQFANEKRFPDAAQVVVGRPQDLVKDLVKHPEDYVAIVTRCHAFDIECLAEALKTGAPYIGLIGSRAKIRQVFAILNKRGVHPEKDGRVYSPIGLDLGDKTPGTIAVSIVSEILKLKNAASGNHMRLSTQHSAVSTQSERTGD